MPRLTEQEHTGDYSLSGGGRTAARQVPLSAVRGQARGGTGLERQKQRGLQHRSALPGDRAGERTPRRKKHPLADEYVRPGRPRPLAEGLNQQAHLGDNNKLILSSLKNGSLCEEIEKQGGLKLIYIDPPFDVGADFSMDIEIGGDTFTKKPNITTNAIERCFRELRKRTRPMCLFGNNASCERIAYALFNKYNNQWQDRPLKALKEFTQES